jgi:hypothetical protein
MTEKKLPLHVMMDHLMEAAQEAFLIEPYLDVVSITYSWRTESNDIPFGFMVGRDGTVTSPASLLEITKQNIKMLKHQSEQLELMFEQVDALANEMAQKIKNLRGAQESV